MNKTIIKTAVAALFSLPLFTSCELDQEPYDTITRDESWSSVGDVDKHYIGLLSFVRAATGMDANQISDVQTDLFNACAGAPAYAKEHSWTFTSSIFVGDAIWNFNYKLNLEANDMLERIGRFYAQPNLSAEDKGILDKSQGMAYFCRALAYMNMVTRYAKDYEPDGSAETLLGLPIVTKVDKTAKPSRATLQQTCNFIQENIDSARKYMVREISVNEPGPAALTALESRFLLYTHQFDKAIELSKSLLGSYPLVASQADFNNMWLNDVSTETILQPVMTPDELGADASLYLRYDLAQLTNGQTVVRFLTSQYVPTQGFIDKFEPNDYRGQYYFTCPRQTYFDDPNLPGLSMIANQVGNGLGKAFCKFQGNRNLLKNPKDEIEAMSKIVNMTKPFRIAEQYLIIAEANLRKDNPNEAEAREYLNQLRKSRGASELEAGVSGEELLTAMQDEWIREFAGEGNRLDCIKRWHQGVNRKAMKPQVFQNAYGKVLYDILPGYVDLNIAPDHYKFVWELPQQDLMTNSNLIPNWKDVQE